jgi:hypothetical protein
VFVLAAVIGFAFGGADQYLGSLVRFASWAPSVSGMSAPWLALPFWLGSTQIGARRAGLLGLTATAAALLGYFALTLSPLEGVSSNQVHLIMFAWSQRLNIVGGAVTGPVFGLLGYRWRTGRSAVSAALVAGAFCLEPVARYALGRLDPPRAVWVVEVLIGLSVAGYFTVVSATRRRAARVDAP